MRTSVTACTALLALSVSLFLATPARAQRSLTDIPPPDVEAELAAFRITDGFEISLFAGTPAVTKPIQMNFDPSGRLWVVSSPLYPHIEPGDAPTDRVLVLTDEDGDGRADRSSVFADDLLMPTGIAWGTDAHGRGGVYVANSTEMLFLADHDGDERADERRVVLSGFGTEDTHHIIHTFRFGPDGLLYFNQSIYIHSHVETPWGVRRMDGGGIWQFRTDALRLEPYLWGMCNPWGHHFDRWGQSIGTDGAGFEGVQYLFPGVTCRHSPRSDPILPGLNPGSPKYCGAEIISGRHMPPEWQGRLVTGDFRAQRVSVFDLRDDGAGFAATKLPDLIVSSHVAFRPIDMKMGPDGALYIADWYNPIIQHGEVSFRDERRNRTHGRIWRVTAKGRPLVERPPLPRAPVEDLIAALGSEEGFTRHFARRELTTRPRETVLAALERRIGEILGRDERDEGTLLEILWTYQTLDVVEPELLHRLLAAAEPRARAAAVRVLRHWAPRLSPERGLDEALSILERTIADEFPRVRLESIRALAALGAMGSADEGLRAIDAALTAVEHSRDPFIDYALGVTVRDLEPIWIAALERGFDFRGDAAKLEVALREARSPDAAGPLLRLADTAAEEKRLVILTLVARAGGPGELSALLDRALALEADGRSEDALQLLDALETAARTRGVKPAGDLSRLGEALMDAPVVLRLTGLWGLEDRRDAISKVAGAAESQPEVRTAALDALVLLGGEASAKALGELATSDDPTRSLEGTLALVRVDPNAAAPIAAARLAKGVASEEAISIVDAFFRRQGGPASLASAIAAVELPTSVADAALRAVRATGRDVPELALAIGSATRGVAKIDDAEVAVATVPSAPVPTAEDIASILAELPRGDATEGERIFRRADLRCFECHAIAGAGGRVGPDLTTIGASAPADYVLTSLLDPNAAIKEGFHAVDVVLTTGEIASGVKLRRSTNDLVILTAEGVETVIPAASIAAEEEAGSIMPRGLIDPLPRSELVHLLRFLTSLGKADWATPTTTYLRTWRVLDAPPADLDRADLAAFGLALHERSDLTWRPDYASISGSLTLPPSEEPVWVKTAIDVTRPGTLELVVDSIVGLSIWVDGESQTASKWVRLDVEAGRREVVFQIESTKALPTLRVALEPEGASAQPVLGR